ncbi:hypothetical protein PanWU01x14_299750 [Parasponia andersonii]|uniref:Transmembrane protein n=1 Tax=Parasponia andersonii TaxID=3476 RepID=A0A2P5AU90_PARAD|nr:hypothetical protein PanWU01x14_299750 [Parasponia andersonii]
MWKIRIEIKARNNSKRRFSGLTTLYIGLAMCISLSTRSYHSLYLYKKCHFPRQIKMSLSGKESIADG